MHGLCAIRQHGHGREQDVDAASGQRRNAVGDRERYELDGHAELLPEKLADIGVEAFLLAAGVDEPEWRIVTLNADDEFAFGFDLGRCDGERRFRHEGGCGKQDCAAHQQVAAVQFQRAHITHCISSYLRFAVQGSGDIKSPCCRGEPPFELCAE